MGDDVLFRQRQSHAFYGGRKQRRFAKDHTTRNVKGGSSSRYSIMHKGQHRGFWFSLCCHATLTLLVLAGIALPMMRSEVALFYLFVISLGTFYGVFLSALDFTELRKEQFGHSLALAGMALAALLILHPLVAAYALNTLFGVH